MKKNFWVKLLAVGMSLSLIACSNGGGGAAQPEPEKEEETAAEETKEETAAEETTSEGETLTVWCWDPNFNIYSMNEAAKIYQKDHPNFTLNVVETPWDDVQTKLSTAGASGDISTLPDIVLMQDNAFQKNVISFPDVFTDVEGSGINFDDFAAGKVAYSVVDGKHYGVPFDNGAVIAAYRTDVLEEAGFTLDDFTDITWDEYLEKGKVVLEKTGHPLLSCISNEVDVVMMMTQSAGGSLFDEKGEPSIAGNEVVSKALETYKTLKDSGVLVEVSNWDQYIESFQTGKVAGTVNGCWIIGSITSGDPEQAGHWGITNMPSLVGLSTATNYSNNGGSSWLLTANCQNKDLAYDFMKSTFGSSVEFYETILPSAGALSCYKPAGESSVYGEPQEFFGGDAIYQKVIDFSGKVPSNNTGVYYYEGRSAIADAAANYIAGADLTAELEAAQEQVLFQMGQ